MRTFFNLLEINIHRPADSLGMNETSNSLIEVKVPYKHRKLVRFSIGVAVLLVGTYMARGLMHKLSRHAA